MTINYEEVVNKHIESGADVTCVYKQNENGRTEFLSSSVFEIEDNRITNIKPNKGDNDNVAVSLCTYVVNYSTFVSLLEKAHSTSPLFSLRDAIGANVDSLKVYGYEYKGYVQAYDSLSAYLRNSLELLDYHKYSS